MRFFFCIGAAQDHGAAFFGYFLSLQTKSNSPEGENPRYESREGRAPSDKVSELEVVILVRIVYLDEAGVSNPKQEPWLVVAGVIVNADKQCKAIERHLLQMVDKYVPAEHREGFSFHAKELINGGKVFDRKKFTLAQRLEILKELCSIPSQYDLPIVFGAIERAEFAKSFSTNTLKNLTIAAQVTASISCSLMVENYMRKNGDAEEVALLTFEDTAECKALIRNSHNYLRGRFLPNEPMPKILPSSPVFTRIIEAPTFAIKSDSSLLQVADACAYALKRTAMFAEGWGDLWPLMLSQVTREAVSDSLMAELSARGLAS